jgi:RIO-like serine/threonine protein kinase
MADAQSAPQRSVAEDAGARAAQTTTMRTLASQPRARAALATLVLALIVTTFALWTEDRVAHIVKQQISKILHVAVDAATEGVRLWIEDAERAANSAARDATVGSLLAACFSAGGNCDSRALDSRLDPYLRAGGFRRFAAVDRNGFAHAGGPLGAIGVPLPQVADANLRDATHATVLPPLRIAGRPVLLVFAPVAGTNGAPSGALWFELPADEFTRILGSARAGETGETYAFDAHGRMLSDSRFVAQLKRIGLLPAGARDAVLGIDVRDPGGDLTRGFKPALPRARQPLTRMAATAITGHDGIDVDGYRDYRGVPVVGVWRWLPAAKIGVVTEVDVDEAYRTLAGLKRIFSVLVSGLVLVAAGMLGAALATARMQRRVQRAEQLASRFGQYRIVRKIGEGGMGAVYLASHELLRRPAALKLLRAERASHDEIARFEREVRLTSSLTHPNTVAVYDYGRAEDGTFYYAMEYLEGLDLHTLVARFGPLPAARVVHLLIQVCGSLSEAHAAGLIHRDIKPANLLVCTRGGVGDIVKVLDFGVVLSLKGRGHEIRDKAAVGTPEFMAPEMFESADQASVQSDLYALGGVAYFLLTGAAPFEGQSTAELCMAHLTQKPEPLAARLGQSPDAALEAALMACLAKRSSSRPSSALSLRALLERSPLSRAWTQADADAWWAARAADIAGMRASAPELPITPGFRTLRPAKSQ